MRLYKTESAAKAAITRARYTGNPLPIYELDSSEASERQGGYKLRGWAIRSKDTFLLSGKRAYYGKKWVELAVSQTTATAPSGVGFIYHTVTK